MPCGAKTRKGHPCTRPDGWGTEHVGWGRCKNHGGNTPDGIRFALRLQGEAEQHPLSLAREVNPLDALLHVVYATAGRVRWLGMEAGKLPEGDAIVNGARGPELAPAALLHGLELDRLARVSKMALDAGVAERRLQMAERTAAVISAALERTLARMGDLPAERRAELVRHFEADLIVLESVDDPSELPAPA